MVVQLQLGRRSLTYTSWQGKYFSHYGFWRSKRSGRCNAKYQTENDFELSIDDFSDVIYLFIYLLASLSCKFQLLPL